MQKCINFYNYIKQKLKLQTLQLINILQFWTAYETKDF